MLTLGRTSRRSGPYSTRDATSRPTTFGLQDANAANPDRACRTAVALPTAISCWRFGRRPQVRVDRPRCRRPNLHTAHKPPLALQKKIGGPPPQGRTYSPNFDRLLIKRLREMTDAAAGVHCRALAKAAVRLVAAGREDCALV